jgi:hypothetical protein
VNISLAGHRASPRIRPLKGDTIMKNVQDYFETWLRAQENIFSGFIETSKLDAPRSLNAYFPLSRRC